MALAGGLLRCRHVVATAVMAAANSDEAIDAALDRIERAVAHLESAANARLTEVAELRELRLRHRRLRESVSGELQQLDLLLANLPK